MKKASLLLALTVAFIMVSGSLYPALAREEGDVAEDEGGGSLRLVIIIAIIWLAIMGLVITVVIVTRRKAGEQERESREG
ncbi:MAG: hypothetical protein SWK76_08375 [Actinomycetota bacterium]|nr:hypothetical protein [Actinomycetota bacterium]